MGDVETAKSRTVVLRLETTNGAGLSSLIVIAQAERNLDFELTDPKGDILPSSVESIFTNRSGQNALILGEVVKTVAVDGHQAETRLQLLESQADKLLFFFDFMTP